MPICTETESCAPNEQPEADASLLDRLKLELDSINEGIRSLELKGLYKKTQKGKEIGRERYFYDSGDKRDDDEKTQDDPYSSEGNYSVGQYTDEDDDTQSMFRCPFCDFEIEVPVLCSRLEEYCFDLKNLVCPVCDEKLGEDAMGSFTKNSNSRKRTWKSEKLSIWSVNPAMLGKKLAAGGNKHAPMTDPLLSQFISNVSVPNPSGIHADEDSMSNAADISSAKSSGTGAAPDTVDEEDHEERRVRAAFVQELVASTIFYEVGEIWW